jgi:hypothetical protein
MSFAFLSKFTGLFLLLGILNVDTNFLNSLIKWKNRLGQYEYNDWGTKEYLECPTKQYIDCKKNDELFFSGMLGKDSIRPT